jgi:hypothetical protein
MWFASCLNEYDWIVDFFSFFIWIYPYSLNLSYFDGTPAIEVIKLEEVVHIEVFALLERKHTSLTRDCAVFEVFNVNLLLSDDLNAFKLFYVGV